MTKPVIAVVGRPNVGKSTLFNRITGGRFAIVDDLPGITRDRIYRDASWQNNYFTVVDTGGLDLVTKEEHMIENVKQQAHYAIEEADYILFVVDGRQGITPADEAAAEIIRKTKKPVLVVVNKIENFDDISEVYEFYNLGFEDLIPVSAEHGYNVGDLLEKIVSNLPYIAEEDNEITKVAIMGRPNVGKSSFVNKILNQDRVIVSNEPGTTRDAVDTYVNIFEKEYSLIDTAGIRRKSRINVATEHYSVIRALRAVDRSEVVLLMIDAVEGVTEQDKRLAGYIHEAGKSIIIVINKWDKVHKEHNTMDLYDEYIREQLRFIQYAPTIYVSALTGKRVSKVFELVDFVSEQSSIRISTGILNEVIEEATSFTPPPTEKGKRLNIYYVTQKGVQPPSFIFFVNNKDLFHFSYKRYLENQLREAFGFEGNPIRFIVKERN